MGRLPHEALAFDPYTGDGIAGLIVCVDEETQKYAAGTKRATVADVVGVDVEASVHVVSD